MFLPTLPCSLRISALLVFICPPAAFAQRNRITGKIIPDQWTGSTLVTVAGQSGLDDVYRRAMLVVGRLADQIHRSLRGRDGDGAVVVSVGGRASKPAELTVSH